MIKFASALLVGTSMLASAPASAADFIKYTFGVTGTATDTNYFTGVESTRTGTIGGEIEYILPASAEGLSSYTNFGTTPDTRPSTISFSASSITFSASQSPLEGSQGRSIIVISGNVCAPSDGTIGGSLGAVDSSCSRVSVSRDANLGQAFRFSGNIHSVSVTRFSADSAVLGVVSFPSAVPEPATWMAMVLGFGLIGAMSRRRYAASARSAASPSR